MNHDITITGINGFSYIEKAYVPNVSNIIIIAEEVRKIVQHYFSAPMPYFTLVNSLRFDYPQTLNTYDQIHICCMDTSWCQIAFQLSHEFCHLMIGKEVISNLRWFEESIAEVASLFFMTQLSPVWKNIGILGHPEYADSIVQYVQQRLDTDTTHLSFSLVEIGNPSSAIWKYLKGEPYNREINKHIAKKLLPIFNANPLLWKIIPELGNLSPHDSLGESFSEWKQLADKQFHESLQQIFDCFTAPNSSN